MPIYRKQSSREAGKAQTSSPGAEGCGQLVMATNQLNAFKDVHRKGCCYPAVAPAIQSNGTRTIRKLIHGTINPSHLTPTHHYPIEM